MYLKQLSILNFKNIEQARVDFSPRINCFTGDNGTGKTNILDAIHYLSMCKSAFNLTDAQCTRHNATGFTVDGSFSAPNGRTEKVVCSYARAGQKKISRGGKEYEKLSDHIGLIPLVLITPSDTSIINESGEERRKYLNSLISQLDRDYLATLIKYNRILAERNKLLKTPGAGGFEEVLEVLDLQMASLGERIHARRHDLLKELAPLVGHHYTLLSGDRESVELEYRSELNDTPPAMLLQLSQQRDRINGFTCCGVHRDDLQMRIGGYPLRKYGSQGQQKSFLVALKLAQYDLIAATHTYRPILLLDDIFDKLDVSRVKQLIEIVADDRFSQIFITDCNKVRLEQLLNEGGFSYTLFQVDQGVIQMAHRQETAKPSASAESEKSGKAGTTSFSSTKPKTR